MNTLQPGRMGVVIKFGSEQWLSYTLYKYEWREYTVLSANISFKISSGSKLQNIQSTSTESSSWSLRPLLNFDNFFHVTMFGWVSTAATNF